MTFYLETEAYLTRFFFVQPTEIFGIHLALLNLLIV